MSVQLLANKNQPLKKKKEKNCKKDFKPVQKFTSIIFRIL